MNRNQDLSSIQSEVKDDPHLKKIIDSTVENPTMILHYSIWHGQLLYKDRVVLLNS